MSDLTKPETTTENEFPILTLEQIESTNPDLAEKIREMESPIKREAAIETYSEFVHQQVEEQMEALRKEAAEEIESFLSKQERAQLKEAASTAKNVVVRGVTSLWSKSKAKVEDTKERVEEYKIEREVDREKERLAHDDYEDQAREIVMQRLAEKAKQDAEAETTDPDVTVVA